MKKMYKIVGGVTITLLLLLAAQGINGSIDLTKDQRHKLSENTKSKLKSLDRPLRIDIFLSGDLPAQYQYFRVSIESLLNNFEHYTDQLYISFINPFEEGTTDSVIEEMQSYGLYPTFVAENNSSTNRETVLFPWAILNHGDHTVRVSLLKKNLGDTPEKILVQSLQQLEFQFMDGIEQITLTEKKNIAFLTSNQTSKNIVLVDLVQSLQSYYNVAFFDFNSNGIDRAETLQNLNRFSLLLISNPKKLFSTDEKYILDQYQLQGGAILWLLDPLIMDESMLMNSEEGAPLEKNQLGLEDYFFNQGIRIQNGLLKDLYCAPIVLARGEENKTQYLPYPWPYYPLIKTNTNVAIGKDLGNVWMRYSSPIDTLRNNQKKTVLLKSSNFSQTRTPPAIISLNEVKDEIKPSQYNGQEKIVGVLNEGQFESLFKNRIKPFTIANPIEKGRSKMLIISDGNFIENQVDKGVPLTLGFDRWSSNFYDNKAFITNCIHYLSGLNNLVELRNKNFKMQFLDPVRVDQESTYWKIFILLAPIFFLVIVRLFIHFILNKHRRY